MDLSREVAGQSMPRGRTKTTHLQKLQQNLNQSWLNQNASNSNPDRK